MDASLSLGSTAPLRSKHSLGVHNPSVMSTSFLVAPAAHRGPLSTLLSTPSTSAPFPSALPSTPAGLAGVEVGAIYMDMVQLHILFSGDGVAGLPHLETDYDIDNRLQKLDFRCNTFKVGLKVNLLESGCSGSRAHRRHYDGQQLSSPPPSCPCRLTSR